MCNVSLLRYTMRMMSAGSHLHMTNLPPLVACHVYLSAGRNPSLIQGLLEQTSLVPPIALLRVFEDEAYNRTGISLAGPPQPIAGAVENLAMAALDAIDMQKHKGSHPRIGSVDHISVHPLHNAALEDAAEVARNVGERIGSLSQVPVYLYGAAHANGKSLADVRRALGYFHGSKGGEWLGPRIEGQVSIPPDYGPTAVSRKSGCTAIGAVPWVINYNIELDTQNLTLAKNIAKSVSERGGGLASIQAMALVHESGSIEIACNILDRERTPPLMLLSKIEELCQLAGLKVRRGYSPGVTPDDALKIWCKNNSIEFEEDGL